MMKFVASEICDEQYLAVLLIPLINTAIHIRESGDEKYLPVVLIPLINIVIHIRLLC